VATLIRCFLPLLHDYIVLLLVHGPINTVTHSCTSFVLSAPVLLVTCSTVKDCHAFYDLGIVQILRHCG